VPAGPINALRRDAMAAHEQARLRAWWERPTRKPAAEPCAFYPGTQLTYLSNVYNEKARAYYHKLGVQMIDAAYEAHEESGVLSLMITSHCLRFSFNLCPKQAKGVQGGYGQVKAEPMTHFPPKILRAGSITCAAFIRPAFRLGAHLGKTACYTLLYRQPRIVTRARAGCRRAHRGWHLRRDPALGGDEGIQGHCRHL
jgi:hypothetical protein